MGRTAPASTATLAALWATSRASRAAMRAAAADYRRTGSTACLSLAVAEADCLSGSAARLARALTASPLASQDVPKPVTDGPGSDILLAHALTLVAYLSAPRCPECGGALD